MLGTTSSLLGAATWKSAQRRAGGCGMWDGICRGGKAPTESILSNACSTTVRKKNSWPYLQHATYCKAELDHVHERINQKHSCVGDLYQNRCLKMLRRIWSTKQTPTKPFSEKVSTLGGNRIGGLCDPCRTAQLNNFNFRVRGGVGLQCGPKKAIRLLLSDPGGGGG